MEEGHQDGPGPRGSGLWGGPYLVEVGDDLVQEAQTLHPHVVAIQLDVEVVEVGDGGEHDPHLRVRLVVQVLGVKGWVSQSSTQGWRWAQAPRTSPEAWLPGRTGTPRHTRRGLGGSRPTQGNSAHRWVQSPQQAGEAPGKDALL